MLIVKLVDIELGLTSNSSSTTHAFSLKVLESYSRDVARGLVRVDYDMLDSAIEPGMPDIAEIKGPFGQSTYAKCVPLYPSDEGKGIARLDEITRINAGVNVGSAVEIRKVGYFKAESVSVALVEPPLPPISMSELAEMLESIPIKGGDRVRLPFFGGKINFKVVKITPSSKDREAAIPTLTTKFTLIERNQ
jgi:transitional endoplasmic reticulum ATPase